MTLQEVRDILDAVIEEYGGDKQVFVPLNMEDEDNLELFPAEVVFLSRESEDVDGNVVSNVAIAVFGTDSP